MHKLAVYDMDNTITRAPTWTPFLIHAARTRAPWRLLLLPLAGLASLAYLARLIDRARLKQITQTLLIGYAVDVTRAGDLAEAFAEQVLAAGVFDGARARIAADHADGYRLVMATASFAFYASAIGRRLGFDTVIATQSRTRDDSRLSALIEGENCYGPAKLRMIEGWLAAQGIARGDARVRFYSDHVSDAPALEWADEAFAVNAHGPLRKLARQRGWTILDWEG